MSDQVQSALAQPTSGEATVRLSPDYFAPKINKSDQDVTALLARLRQVLDSQGECDQRDLAALDWDDARDLLAIATVLWEARQ